MQAHRLRVEISEDHQLHVALPDDFPAGPAELIVLSQSPERPRATHGRRKGSAALPEANERMLELLKSWHGKPLSADEKRIHDDFEAFQAKHPLRLSRLEDVS